MSIDGPVLVTGAAGCIGAWVVAGLVQRGKSPVVFDLSEDRRRLRLLLSDEQANAVKWLKGDLTDTAAVERAVGDSGAAAIIHLAALQVPFCKADPVLGARVNVVGHVNVFEAARKRGVKRLVYASSIAALPVEGGAYQANLYGVYKAADEGIARIYAQDWSVASVGLRPHTVYGPGRDQGLTSAPTKAMLAAAADKPYTVPFRGTLNFQYAGEVAEIFTRCAEAEVAAGHSEVYDLQGTKATVEAVVDRIRQVAPAAKIAVEGANLPFPAEFDDRPLRKLIGSWPATALDTGVEQSIRMFRDLLKRGLVSADT
jgi:nucleoside-diphosphate-sugar epimerase